MGRVTVRRKVTQVGESIGGSPLTRTDTLAVEEPLEVRVGGRSLLVTMRSPGDDIDLVHGYLATEAVIRSAADVSVARYCAGAVNDEETGLPQNTYNVIDVALAADIDTPIVERRPVNVAKIQERWPFDIGRDGGPVPAAVLARLPDALRVAMATVDRTGSLHAAGLFRADGSVLCVRADVGRANAVDKVIGWAVRADLLPLRGCVLVVPGRVSFELTQKAAMAGIPVLAAIAAPSSLGVELAERAGMTVAVLSGSGVTVYNRPDRVTG